MSSISQLLDASFLPVDLFFFLFFLRKVWPLKDSLNPFDVSNTRDSQLTQRLIGTGNEQNTMGTTCMNHVRVKIKTLYCWLSRLHGNATVSVDFGNHLRSGVALFLPFLPSLSLALSCAWSVTQVNFWVQVNVSSSFWNFEMWINSCRCYCYCLCLPSSGIKGLSRRSWMLLFTTTEHLQVYRIWKTNHLVANSSN